MSVACRLHLWVTRWPKEPIHLSNWWRWWGSCRPLYLPRRSHAAYETIHMSFILTEAWEPTGITDFTKPTWSTGDPGHILGLGGTIATLLSAPTSGWPRGAHVDLTHFEEGHHERLLVIRAISAHQACSSGVDVESLNANQSTSLLFHRNIVLQLHNWSFPTSQSLVIKDECKEQAHASSDLWWLPLDGQNQNTPSKGPWIKARSGYAQAPPFLLVFFLPIQSFFLIIFTPTVTSQAEQV